MRYKTYYLKVQTFQHLNLPPTHVRYLLGVTCVSFDFHSFPDSSIILNSYAIGSEAIY